MAGLGEQQAYDQFEVAVRTCLNESDLMSQAQVLSFSVMLNSGVISG